MKREHSQFLLRWMAPGICVIVSIVIIIVNFFSQLKLDSISRAENEMISVGSRYAMKVMEDLKGMYTAGKVVSGVLYREKDHAAEAAETIFPMLTAETAAYQAVWYMGEGKGLDGSGETTDISAVPYYDRITEKNVHAYQFLKGSECGGIDTILLSLPGEKGAEEKLLLYYPASRLESLVKINTEFDSEAFAALISADGNFLYKDKKESGFLTGENLWEAMEAGDREAAEKARIRIMNESPGSLQGRAGNEKRTLVYIPVGVNDWAVVFGINQSYVDGQIKEGFETASGMLWRMLGIILLAIAVFGGIYRMTRRHSEESSRLLREKADTDLLTGLYNKLATEKLIQEYIEEFPDSLGMMFVLDVDYFKKINDTMGHAFGDEVLRSLGKQISSVFRVTDIIGRTGGDEFMIFLKGLKNDQAALDEAKKLVDFFKDFVAGEYVKYSVTASIGAAVFPADGSDFDGLYRAADKALYKAKQRGRNQLAFFDDRDR